MSNLYPENLYEVGVDSSGFFCRPPKAPELRMSFDALAAVYLQTNDSGPWGADVWWALQGQTEGEWLIFPQGATGEDRILERLKKLPGFQIKGMNSTANARFLCWPTNEQN